MKSRALPGADGCAMTDGSEIRTEKTGTGDPEGMTLYAELSFYLGDTEWRLQKFAQSDLVDHGELLLDDRCRFLIRAVSGDGAYVFFDEAVQLGEPEADVWTDPEDRLHVVIRDAGRPDTGSQTTSMIKIQKFLMEEY